ncbi:GNAT family N-acetyltransferase [Halostella pelagica]|uniref:GNAT family N-acetyltransferase n=1 Tax=Halostella pelagica TaxID=2583824 RepID=UPI001081930E|nr:GNAT family N-acetyltransferase [Halostella pelagica]
MADEATIRPAERGDIDGIQRVARRAWGGAYGGVLPEDALDEMLAVHYSDEVLGRTIASSKRSLFVAEDDGTIVGYASGGPSDIDVEGELSIYLDPDWWGQGLGKRLLDCVAESLAEQDVERIEEKVLDENEVGNAFYEKHFDRVGREEIEIGGTTWTANVYRTEIA